MNSFFTRCLLICFLGLAHQAFGQNLVLYDFEKGDEGWRADWGCSLGGPDPVTDESHRGKGAIAFTHHFEKEQESAAGSVSFDQPKNFTGYKKLTAWVYFPPKSYDWQAQIYVRSGDEAEASYGKLEQGLKEGWHQLTIESQDILDIASVKAVGVQVKNWTIDREMRFCIDEVEAISK